MASAEMYLTLREEMVEVTSIEAEVLGVESSELQIYLLVEAGAGFLNINRVTL